MQMCCNVVFELEDPIVDYARVDLKLHWKTTCLFALPKIRDHITDMIKEPISHSMNHDHIVSKNWKSMQQTSHWSNVVCQNIWCLTLRCFKSGFACTHRNSTIRKISFSLVSNSITFSIWQYVFPAIPRLPNAINTNLKSQLGSKNVIFLQPQGSPMHYTLLPWWLNLCLLLQV